MNYDVIISLTVRRNPLSIKRETESRYEHVIPGRQKKDCDVQSLIECLLKEGYVLSWAYWFLVEEKWGTKKTAEYIFTKRASNFNEKKQKLVLGELYTMVEGTTWRTVVGEDALSSAVVIKADSRQEAATAKNMITIEEISMAEV